ncbi:MAG: aldo/keto reductase [Phycisphaerae bacterium]|nr:aldo/keto reductase [Phycisphaerae bacterium]
MELRPLGTSGIAVSVLGLGTVKLGRNRGVRYPAAFEVPTDEAAERLLRCAAEVGVTLLDTAPAYGASEERLGRLVGRVGRRDRWVLCTKAGEEFEPAAAGGEGASRFDFSPRAVRSSVERSLIRLGVEHLDIVLLHCDGRDAWIVRESGALDELLRLKHEGKLGAAGASTKTIAGGLAAVERGDVVMVAYSPWDRDAEPVIDAARVAGKGVLVKKALGSGWLGSDASGAGHAGRADPGAALRFAAGKPGVSSVVVGTIDEVRLRANARAIDQKGTSSGSIS